MDENDTHDFLQQNIFNFQYLKQRAVKDTRGFSQHHWNLFRFVHIISAESNVTFLIPFIFFLVRILQSIASFSIGTMFTIEDLGENKTFLHKLIRIALPEPRSSYSGHIMTIALVSIFSFNFGLFYMKRKVIGKKFAFFLYIFTGELPEVYVTALASFIGYFLALLFKNELRILQIFIVAVLFLAGSANMMYTIEVTMHRSLTYFSGRLTTCTAPKKTVLTNAFLVFFISFIYNALDSKTYYILLTILLITVGVFTIMQGKCIYFINGFPDIESIAKGIGMIYTGINSFHIYLNPTNNIQLFFLTPVAVYIISYIILALYYRSQSRKKAEMLVKCQNYNELPIKSIYDLIAFMSSGFYHGAKPAIDGDLIEWGISKFNAADLSNVMMTYASLLNNPPMYKSYLDDVLNPTEKTFEEEFITYEYLVMQDAKIVKETPHAVVPAINDAIKKCTDFPAIEKRIVEYLSADATANYYLTQLVDDIRDSIHYYVWTVSSSLPNSLLVLKLSYEFNLNVLNNKLKAKAIKQNIEDVEHGRTKYVNIEFMNALTILPEARQAIAEHNDTLYNSNDSRQIFKNEDPEFLKTQESSSDGNADIEIVGNTAKESNYRISYCITIVLIILLLVSLLFSFGTYHGYFAKYLSLIEQCILLTDYKFQETKTFALGTVGSIIQIHGSGNNTILDNIKRAYTKFADIEEYLSVYKNENMYQKNSNFKTFIEDISSNLSIPSIGNPGIMRETTFPYAVEKFFDYLYESINETENSTALSERWIEYFTTMHYCLSASSNKNNSIQYYQAYDNWREKSFNDLCKKFNIVIVQNCVAYCIVIIYILYRAISMHVATCKMENKFDDIVVVKGSLRSNYLSLLNLIIRSLILIAFCVALSWSIFSINKGFAKYAKDKFGGYFELNANDIQTLLLGYSGTNAFELANYIEEMDSFTSDDLYTIINNTLAFFLNSNRNSTSLKLGRTQIDQYTLIQEFVVHAQKEIDTSIEIALHLRDLFLLDFMPVVERYYNTSIDEQRLYIVYVSNYFTIILIVTIIFLMTIGVIIINIIIKIGEAYISAILLNPFFGDVLKAANDVPIKGRNNQFELNCLSQPCAFTNERGQIIGVNNRWRAEIGKMGHNYIGKPCSRYTERFPEDKIISVKLTEQINLTIIDFYSDELSSTEEYKRLFNEVLRYRIDLGLTRFINADIDTHHYDFITAVVVSWNPVIDYDPLKKRKEILNYALPLLKEYVDIDYMRTTARHSVFLFGINDTINEQMMVTEALSFATELLLFTSQHSKLTNFNPSIAIISGDLTCKLPDNKIEIVDVSGSVFNKLPYVASQSVPNSITMCKETYEKSQKYFFPRDATKKFTEVRVNNKECEHPVYQCVFNIK